MPFALASFLVPSLGHHKLRKLTAAMVQASYTNALENGRKQKSGGGLAPITVRRHHAVRRAALRDARRQGLVVTEAVADNARPPRGAGKVRKALSLEGVKVFLDGLVQHPDRVAANAMLLSLYLGKAVGASDRTVADRLGHSSPLSQRPCGHALRGKAASAADGLAAVLDKAKGE